MKEFILSLTSLEKIHISTFLMKPGQARKKRKLCMVKKNSLHNKMTSLRQLVKIELTLTGAAVSKINGRAIFNILHIM